jgi:ribonuclease BN (tRNA processing enzyme)
VKSSLIATLMLALAAPLMGQSPAPASAAQTPLAPSTITQVVVLGTGTPAVDVERSHPAVAVVVNGEAYLVDFGAGVVRQAEEAAEKDNIPALKPARLRVVFCTHLHSDHTAGLPDLFLTPAVMGRPGALEIYGPPGIDAMAKNIRAAYSKDIDIRVNGLEHGNAAAYVMNVHEIAPAVDKPEVIYKDGNVTVTAFRVAHGSWDYSLGYRFDTPDRSIVMSGDTGPTDAVARACHGCDIMMNEVYSLAGNEQAGAAWKAYFASFHMSTAQLAHTAEEAHPRVLVLYHQMNLVGSDPDAELVKEIHDAGYKGDVVSAHDLEVF